MAGMAAGVATVGGILDLVEQGSPEQRRRLADLAREAAGLRSFTTIEWEAELQADQERWRRAAPPRRDPDGRSFQVCHEPGCLAQAFDSATGAPAPVAAKRWWCEAHRAGQEDDMEPWSRSYRYSPETGLLVDDDDDAEAERERLRSEHELERQRQRREQSQAERRVIAAERREYERAREEQHRRETPEGFPT
jgi:hypothetical protein